MGVVNKRWMVELREKKAEWLVLKQVYMICKQS